MDKIAVLIPCYNEELTIKKVINDFQKELENAVIYVYDNNSIDNTAIIAKKEGAIVGYEYMQGKGNVIRRMFREIDAQCYLLVDGDDTYPAKSAKEMTKLVLEKNADMVVGDRLSATYNKENKRLFHNFGNELVRRSINFLFSTNVKDIMTGYRAFSYEFVKTFSILSKGFEIETEMTIHAIDKNMQISNVVVEYRDRPLGSKSKLNTFSDGFKVIKTIISMYRIYKPFMFFLIVTIFLMIIAAVFFIPILITYIKIKQVPKFPTMIVCGFVVLAAIQSFFAGLILQTITKKNKQDFECRLIETSNHKKKLLGK